MKHLLLILIIMLVCPNVQAQRPIGTWEQYRAYGNATDQVVANGLVYAVASGNLLSYDPETAEVQTFDIQNGLSSSGISFIEHDATTSTLVIAYADGTIDLMDTRSQNVVGLTALRDKQLSSKTVNNVFTHEGRAWLAMSFGLVEIDLINKHFGETYDWKVNVTAGSVYNGVLYYSISGDGLYKVSMSDNLHDKNAHSRLNSHVYTAMLTMGKYVYGYSYPFFYRFDPDGGMKYTTVGSNRMMPSHVNGGCIVANNASTVAIIEEDGEIQNISVNNDFKSIVRQGNTYWISRGLNGLQAYKLVEGTLKESGFAINTNSPRYDYFYRMSYVGERLLVAGGTHDNTAANYEGMASLYERGTWTNLDTVRIGTEVYQNITGIAQNPADPTQHFVTSMGHGLYVYRDGHLETRYNHTNSPLATILPNDAHPENYIRTNAPTFDNEGRLWLLNCRVDTLLWCFDINRKKWTGYYFEEIEASRCPDHIYFDKSGRIWILLREMAGRGIMCYDPQTRRHILRGTIEQQDGQKYAPDQFLCMAADKSDAIWVGTEQGLFRIDNPDDFFDNDFLWTQIKVNREDGSGLADYLLSGAYITSIAVDGGNRKWVGTTGSGVYLISADGQETLEHFTMTNSPLPSDDIRSIAINPVTGEVMIGTENGLASYMGSATEPEESLDKNNIEIYPNPVSPDYSGDVIIRGMAADCEVKIATVTGQVVWSGTSVGGTLTWDLQHKGGGKVASGIYNVIINTNEGRNVIVDRVAVVR